MIKNFFNSRIPYVLALLPGLFVLFGLCGATAHGGEKPEIFVQMGHSAIIRSLSYSPDGRYLVSASEDKTVKVWEVATGREIQSFLQNYATITAVITPDNRQILSADNKGMIRLQDIATRQLIWEVKHPVAGSKIQFSPDGKKALSADGSGLVYWNIGAKEQIFRKGTIAMDIMTTAVLSNDGRFIVASTYDMRNPAKRSIEIYDVERKSTVRTIPAGDDRISALCFSPDGRYILSGSSTPDGKTGVMKVWNAGTGAMVKAFPIERNVWSVAFSPDGKYAAAGCIGQVSFFDAVAWEQKSVFRGYSPAIFSPDSRVLTCGSEDEDVYLIDPASKKLIKALTGNTQSVPFAAFGPTGRTIETARFAWDIDTGTHKKHVLAKDPSGKVRLPAIVSPDAKYAVEAHEGHFYLWDLSMKKMLHRFETNPAERLALRFSPDSRYLLEAFKDGALVLWNLQSHEKMWTASQGWTYSSDLCFSPDGRHAFSVNYSDVTIRMWDAQTGAAVKSFHDGGKSIAGLAAVNVSPDGRYLLSGGFTKGAKYPVTFWDIATGQQMMALEGHTYIVSATAFSHDGKYALSGSHDQTVKLWDLESWKEVRTFRGHTGVIRSTAFSPDGRRIISTSNDGTIILWDMATGKEIARFISFIDDEWIVITPEGYFNASSKGAKHLNVRVGDKVYGIDNFYEKFFNPLHVASVLQGMKVEALADIRSGIMTPPEVRIASPKPGETINRDALSVTVVAKDTGGGIDEVRLYHNGKVVGEDARAVKIVPKDKEASKTYNVTLVDGINTFRAVGFSKDRTESNPYEMTVHLSAPQKDVSLHVLAVGINKYRNPALNLNYAVPDAQGIAAFFKEKETGLFKKVNIISIHDEQATRHNITAQLKSLEKTNPQDAVLIYLAGHGRTSQTNGISSPMSLPIRNAKRM